MCLVLCQAVCRSDINLRLLLGWYLCSIADFNKLGQIWTNLGPFLSCLGQKWPKPALKSINNHYWSVFYWYICLEHKTWCSCSKWSGNFEENGKKTQNLKIAITSFGSGIGAHFFYISTQNTNQMRKKLSRRWLRNYGLFWFLTQLFYMS